MGNSPSKDKKRGNYPPYNQTPRPRYGYQNAPPAYPIQNAYGYQNAYPAQNAYGYNPAVQSSYGNQASFLQKMANVVSEDLTCPWGQQPDPLDFQYGKWRVAVFQDLQESIDQSKLYFLYDPTADDQCITTGGRKSMTCLAVFDVNRKCFVGEIPIRVQGRVKMLFALPQASPGGGTSFVITSQSEDYGQYVLHVWRFDLTSDGMNSMGDPRSLLNSPLTIDSDFICSLRDDAPELVVVSGPQMSVSCINVNATTPQSPTNRFNVAGAELSHFYDGFLSRGNVYFLSASPDGHLDYSRIHILSLQSQQLTTQFCQPDPTRGLPSARKQAALDSTQGFILLAGGEIDYGNGDVQRLVDYWVLDLSTFKWNQIQSQMSVPLIEPRLTTANSGNVYVWGDFDDPLPNMQEGSTHVRILRVRGLNGFNPPSYGTGQPQYGMPQQSYGYNQGGSQAPYPANVTYPDQPPPYGQPSAYNQGGSQYPQQNYGQGYGAPSQNSYQEQAYYPPQEKKKDCTIS